MSPFELHAQIENVCTVLNDNHTKKISDRDFMDVRNGTTMSKHIEENEKEDYANLLFQVESCLIEIEDLIDTGNQSQIEAWFTTHVLALGTIRTEACYIGIVCSIRLNEGRALLEFRRSGMLNVYLEGIEKCFSGENMIPELFPSLYCYLLSLQVLSNMRADKEKMHEDYFCTIDEFYKEIL